MTGFVNAVTRSRKQVTAVMAALLLTSALCGYWAAHAPAADAAISVTVVSATFPHASSGSVSCGPLEEAVGGGFTTAPAEHDVQYRGPSADEPTPATQGAVPTGWQVNMNSTGNNLTVYAVCATADAAATVQAAKGTSAACPVLAQVLGGGFADANAGSVASYPHVPDSWYTAAPTTFAVCSDLTLTETLVSSVFNGTGTGTVSCPAGTHAYGGGWQVAKNVTASRATDASDTSWTVSTLSATSSGAVVAVCVGLL
jgi:hypothetical protein